MNAFAILISITWVLTIVYLTFVTVSTVIELKKINNVSHNQRLKIHLMLFYPMIQILYSLVFFISKLILVYDNNIESGKLAYFINYLFYYL
jgi:hypothetical protein